jgi:hypothetical protein
VSHRHGERKREPFAASQFAFVCSQRNRLAASRVITRKQNVLTVYDGIEDKGFNLTGRLVRADQTLSEDSTLTLVLRGVGEEITADAGLL